MLKFRTSLLAASLALLALGSMAQADTAEEEFAKRIQFTAITYDNGLGGWLKGVTSLFYDRYTDELYACAPGDHSIIVYDQNLSPRFAFEHFVTDRLTGRRTLGEPRSVAVTPDGDMLVIDGLADYIDVLDYRGEQVQQLWVNEIYGDTSLTLRPISITMDEADNYYLLVSGELETVLVLDRDFGYKRRIGRRGTDPHEFTTVVGMEARKGRVILTDLYALPALKIFDTLGQYLSGFGGHTVEKNDITMVSGLAMMIDTTGGLVIFSCDELRQVVKVFSEEGQFIYNIGGWGNSLGALAYPSDIVSGRDGVFFISERVGKRIQKFIVN